MAETDLNNTSAQVADNPVEISAIVTCYYEENSIEEFFEKLYQALESTGRSYEIIMVNDGSTDKTFDKLKEIFHKYTNVKMVMDLFKNAGQPAAVTAAITHSKGRIIFLLDSDLQFDPMEVKLLLKEYDKGYDVVSGARKNRKDSLLRIIPSKVANYIMRKASQSDFTDFGCTFKLYNADIIHAYELGPTNIINAPRIISSAQNCCEVPITHYPRKYGKSGWTFRKLWDYNMENLMEMSRRPFQILGGLCLFAAFLFILRVVIDIFFPFEIIGQITNALLLYVIIISFLITAGTITILGEFTIRIYLSTQKKPRYIIREKLER